jgi:ornithine cyclodeaminase
MKIFSIDQIQSSLNINRDLEALINSQKSAFVDYSSGLYDVPLPIHFIFPKSASDCHIKGGYRQDGEYFIVKIAGSSQFGNNGLILLFDVTSCELRAILQDNGFLTTLRTAIAGIICLTLMPWAPQNIGIIGSGNLAGQLYELLRIKYPQVNVMIYGRNKAKASAISDLVCDRAEDLAAKCDVVFTTTASLEPIIHAISEGKNTAIIGLGSDDAHKSEIAPQLFKTADMVIVDSKMQATKFGDVGRALRDGLIGQSDLLEIGALLKSSTCQNAKTIIADFSGIGAQDVAITEFILPRLCRDGFCSTPYF